MHPIPASDVSLACGLLASLLLLMPQVSFAQQPPGIRTDHPLAQEDLLLQQPFLAGNERLFLQSGTDTLGPGGSLQIELPAYYGALTAGHRYQLTPIGAPAHLYVKEPLADNRFVIAAEKGPERAGLAVSWLVMGRRADPVAKARPFEPVREKDTLGHYLETEVYEFLDVYDMPETWHRTADSLLQAFLREAGLEDSVIDYGIGGSLALGVARRPNVTDPSDVDFIVTTAEDPDHMAPQREERLNLLVGKYRRIMRNTLGWPDLLMDIFLAGPQYYKPGQEAFVLYSYKYDKGFGRQAGDPPFYKKQFFHEGKWYWLNRGKYNAMARTYGRRIHFRIFPTEDGRLELYHPDTNELLLVTEPFRTN